MGALDALFAPRRWRTALRFRPRRAALSPACKVYGVEPEAGDDGRRSFRFGAIVHIDIPKTMAHKRSVKVVRNGFFIPVMPTRLGPPRPIRAHR